ncbi:MAG: aminotransferase class III-fold pyridoxal phosphate-dependent enzyme [Chlamydiales bacterium]|nr:aminotransferase class III-fold pyridoxal phosphate-dependent enzyme [Chlamydiales bacterium]
MGLIKKQFQEDPRYQTAKKALLELYTEYQHKIDGIKPAQSNLKCDYDKIVQEFESSRGIKLWYPYVGSGFGKGAYVELLDGSVKLDFISGIGAHFEHGNTAIISAMIDAAFEDKVMQGNLQQNMVAKELSSLLLKSSGFDHVFLSTSGAMACENALKIIFQKKSPARRILAFEHCFMGRTHLLAQITDKPELRKGLPSTTFVDYLPFYDPLHPKESIEKALSLMKTYIKRYPNDYAVFCLELVQGEGGINVGSRDFFLPLIELAKAHNIAIFVDEVQTFGRTENLFAYQYFDLFPYIDVVSIGKLSQIAATLFKSSFKPLPNLLSQTFIGSTSALYGSFVIIKSLLSDNYLGPSGKIKHLHTYFLKHFERLHKIYPDKIEGPYGLGGLIAFTPFKGDKEQVTLFAHKLFSLGLIIFLTGENPSRIRMLPPIGNTSEKDIDQAFTIIEEALKQI